MRTYYLYSNGQDLEIETDDDPSPLPENPETDDVIAAAEGAAKEGSPVKNGNDFHEMQDDKDLTKVENSKTCILI